MKKFVIFSYPRTGSTFLVKNLNNFEDVVCQSEIFHKNFNSFSRAFLDKKVIMKFLNSPFKRIIFNKEKVLKKLFRMKNRDFHSFLEKVYQEKFNAVGFKIFPGQHDEAFKYLLGETSIRKVILERRNRLRSYVSKQISIKTGRWDQYKGNDSKLVQIEINIEDFLLYKQKIDAYLLETEQALKLSNQKYLKLTFEEITSGFPLKKISRFLDIGNVDSVPEVNQKRQNPFPLSEMILNYEELSNYFENTEFEKYLIE